MMKLWWHKLKNWEYWSSKIIYLPTFFLWVGYAIKFRTIKFYAHSNPAIVNGGLHGDGKMAVYKLFPENLYPKTVLSTANNSEPAIKTALKAKQMNFPLIVKPDVGYRGIGVAIVNNMKELIAYANTIHADFLIQEIAAFPNEIGLFYYRLPNEKAGKISGITLKTFLTVVGNGRDNITELLKKDPRHEMQISKLSTQLNLAEILQKDEKRCLVPFGNHNRGTLFTDGEKHITPQLEQTFNAILSKIEGLNYGRLDIRFNSFKELEAGKNFLILEMNGAKSEPTHIYDPKYSFLKGQKEIFKHQLIFGKIIKSNIQKYRAKITQKQTAL